MGTLQPEQEQSLSLMAEKSQQLTYMVNDIISLQAVESIGYDLDVLALDAILLAAVDHLRPKADKAGIRFELDVPPAEDIPPIHGDARRIGRVLDHLLDNAVKFSPNGGVVQLSVEHDESMLFLRIRDEGIGLSEAQLERIFDRFYQVDGSSTRRYGGTGLGLTQAK
jgi:signal transduction histidine kinase